MEDPTSFKLLQMYIRLDRWNNILTDHELKSDAEVLELLLQHYENTVQGMQNVAYCGDCMVPLALSCPKCSAAHAAPPSSAKDYGHMPTFRILSPKRKKKRGRVILGKSDADTPISPDLPQPQGRTLLTLPPDSKTKSKKRGRVALGKNDGHTPSLLNSPQRGSLVPDLSSGQNYPGLKSLAPKPDSKNQTRIVLSKNDGNMPNLSFSPRHGSLMPLPSDLVSSQNSPGFKSLAPKPESKNEGCIVINTKAGVVAPGTFAPVISIFRESLPSTASSTTGKSQTAKGSGKAGDKRKQEGKDSIPTPRRSKYDRTEKEILEKCSNMTMEQLQEELSRFVRTGECDCKEYSVYIKQYVSKYSTECPVCRRELGNKSYRLRQHLVSHMASPKVKCKLCSKTFSSLYRRYHHMREVHWKVKISAAAAKNSSTSHGKISRKRCLELVELKRRRREFLYGNAKVRTQWDNMTAEEMEKEFKPFIESNDYESKELCLLLDKYIKVSNGNCPICHKKVRKIRYILRRHLLTHMTNPQLKCSICPMTFEHPKYRNKHELEEHFLEKGGDVDDEAAGELCGKDHVPDDLILRWDNMESREMQAEIFRLLRESEFESKQLSVFLNKFMTRAYTGFCPVCGQRAPTRKDPFHRHLFRHMSHAKATCHYCSMTFTSLSTRYRHELKEHSKSLKKKAALDRVGGNSGETSAAGQNVEGGPFDTEGGSPDIETWVKSLGQEPTTQLVLRLDYPLPGTIADEHGYTLKVEVPDGSRVQPEEGLEQAVGAGLALFGDQQKLQFNTVWDNWTLEQLVEKLKEFVRNNDHESQELQQFMPVYRRVSLGVCHLCPKDVPFKAKSTAALTKHLVTHMPNPCLRCSHCPLTFTSIRLQRLHFAKVHEQKECMCEVCGEAFTNIQKLHVHSSGCKNSFACRFCQKQYKYKHYCAKHEKIVHGVDKYIEYPCPTCDKTFHSKADLRKHIDVHGEKKYHCSICPKKYFTKMGLTLHMANHTSQPPRFECEVCNKKFHWKKNLEAHSRSHSNNRPFACEVCGRGFKSRSGRAKHRRLHTGERPYPCPEPGCGRAFVTKYLLRLHRQSKHNYQASPDENAPVAASSDVIYTYFSSSALGDIPPTVEVQETQEEGPFSSNITLIVSGP